MMNLRSNCSGKTPSTDFIIMTNIYNRVNNSFNEVSHTSKPPLDHIQKVEFQRTEGDCEFIYSLYASNSISNYSYLLKEELGNAGCTDIRQNNLRDGREIVYGHCDGRLIKVSLKSVN